MEYIDRIEALEKVCRIISDSPWASLDTEADSLHHYFEKLSLVQVSVKKHDFVIDPLSCPDLTQLVQILNQKFLILQGADFDVRILRRSYDFRPRQIFDTMIAAQLLGYPKQGLADLAQRHCAVFLPKQHQKADWSERPLSQELLEYAANDTHYLKTIEEKLTEELRVLGRLEWHKQTCQKLLNHLMSRTEAEPDENPWQIRGSKNLKGKALNILRAIWYWRDGEARRRDKPPFKILNSDSMLLVSEWASKTDSADIGMLATAPRHIRQEYRQMMNELFQRAKEESPLTWQGPPKSNRCKTRWTDTNEKILERLKLRREELAKNLGIAPGLLANNAVLEKCAVGDSSDFMPWQKDIFFDGFSPENLV